MAGASRLRGLRPAAEVAPPPGVRVVIDARALQEPERAPLTAAYLDGLLGGFDADPVEGESFALLLSSDADDPTQRFASLSVIGRRLLPPTRLLRSGALTVDPFVLRGASLGAAWRAERGGAAGAVYHAAGGGLPIASGLPVIATLLDLAPWSAPEHYQRGRAARFGQRLRAQLLREAAIVIVGSDEVAAAARKLLRIKRDRLRVVPLAARPAFLEGPVAHDAPAPDAPPPALDRAGPGPYLVYGARHDARHDLVTLTAALARLAATRAPASLPDGAAWPPRIVITEASPDDRADIAKVAARHGVGDALTYIPAVPPAELAAIVRGARAALVPMRSDATGFAALDALAVGVPVVASAVEALPGIVGTAGILVEPRDVDRLATALTTIWTNDSLHKRLAAAAAASTVNARTWRDVARDVRAIYAEVGVPRD
jgi:glycosyltransferase involved in cell wall biosynthesis